MRNDLKLKQSKDNLYSILKEELILLVMVGHWCILHVYVYMPVGLVGSLL